MASVGVGRTQRGFERVFSDLFEVTRDRLPITLYKSGGVQSDREKMPPLLRQLTAIVRPLPLGVVANGAEYSKYKNDCAAFSLAILPELMRHRFDIIHFIDYPLGIAIRHLQRIFRFPGRLLYTNACLMPPQFYPRAHVHHCAEPFYRQALASGVNPDRLTLVPLGVHTGRFVPDGDPVEIRRSLRRKFGIADDTFVIMVVSAVKRPHKRVDHIIEEASRLQGNFLLWVDGNPEDPTLPVMGKERLGEKFRVTHVPTADVPQLYHLADVMVHAALEEAFGLAVVEALASGVMVLTHDSPHFRWLVRERDCLVDMSTPGALAAKLEDLMRRPGTLRESAPGRQAAAERFAWGILTDPYLEMYRKIATAEEFGSDGRVVSHASAAA